jgi:hypothetical protein
MQIPDDILFGPQTLGSEDDYLRYIKEMLIGIDSKRVKR